MFETVLPYEIKKTVGISSLDYLLQTSHAIWTILIKKEANILGFEQFILKMIRAKIH